MERDRDADCCVQFLSTKNTIMKKYDGRFKDIFQEIYDQCVSLPLSIFRILTLKL